MKRNEKKLTKSLVLYAGKCFSCRKNWVFSHYFFMLRLFQWKEQKTMSVKWEDAGGGFRTNRTSYTIHAYNRTSLIVISEENLHHFNLFSLLLYSNNYALHNNKQHFGLSIFASSSILLLQVGRWYGGGIGSRIRLKGLDYTSEQRTFGGRSSSLKRKKIIINSRFTYFLWWKILFMFQ